jgi:NAD(P)-dependent dehydrogenase (short-subunit alcohol dehydrogenase family)
MRLDGHVAVVTGAASGIGQAITIRFMAEGAHVVALDRFQPSDGDLALVCDVSSDDDIARAAQAVEAAGLQPSILVHAAAKGESAATLETGSAFLAEMMDVNLGGAFRMVQTFAPAMQTRKRGAILFISSINSGFGTPGLAAYAASKAAIDNFTKTLAIELAPDNIRVNAIRPASIDTPLLRRGFEAQPDPEAARRRNIARHPLGRLGTVDDVARLTLFLASDEASWITGADYLIDGGAGATRI